MELAVGVLNKRERVFADLALSTGREGNVEWLFGEVGSKKILYASDMPFYDPRPTFGRVALADITDRAKRDIFAGNIRALLGLD